MRNAIFAAFIVPILGLAHAAGPFDGNWVGETPPLAANCGTWKFYFTVLNGNVSGLVEGLLNGKRATGTVLSGAVNPDGTAEVVWGRTYQFRGGFRFTQNSWQGNVTTACGQTTMTGTRAQS